MKKTPFDLKLYNEMYQLFKIANDQGTNIPAEGLRDHFEIPDRVARYYHFMIRNSDKVKNNILYPAESRLIIPDIHAPFVRKGFLEHCIEAYHRFNCTKVTFLGDVIDNHFPSNYSVDPDGMSAKAETDLAIEVLQPWYNAFPKAEVCIGNHDARIHRQAFDAGISKMWIKDYSEVINTPGWIWDEFFDHYDVRYTHGDGPGGGLNGAYNRMMNWRFSVVQGHWHTSSYTRWSVSEIDRRYGFQLGCGIDHEAYAMAYGKKSMRKMVIECGVILDDGRIPIHLPMYL